MCWQRLKIINTDLIATFKTQLWATFEYVNNMQTVPTEMSVNSAFFKFLLYKMWVYAFSCSQFLNSVLIVQIILLQIY